MMMYFKLRRVNGGPINSKMTVPAIAVVSSWSA
jgi:hypothetical protein